MITHPFFSAFRNSFADHEPSVIQYLFEVIDRAPGGAAKPDISALEKYTNRNLTLQVSDAKRMCQVNVGTISFDVVRSSQSLPVRTSLRCQRSNALIKIGLQRIAILKK